MIDKFGPQKIVLIKNNEWQKKFIFIVIHYNIMFNKSTHIQQNIIMRLYMCKLFMYNQSSFLFFIGHV